MMSDLQEAWEFIAKGPEPLSLIAFECIQCWDEDDGPATSDDIFFATWIAARDLGIGDWAEKILFQRTQH
jgi:hypothetical protein